MKLNAEIAVFADLAGLLFMLTAAQPANGSDIPSAAQPTAAIRAPWTAASAVVALAPMTNTRTRPTHRRRVV